MPLLFSYGTLQQHAVQLETFGRVLHGWRDEIVGFALKGFHVDDAAFVAKSGSADQMIVAFNGRRDSRVPGVVLELTDAELAMADAYEPRGYTRMEATLASGARAWIYAESNANRFDHR